MRKVKYPHKNKAEKESFNNTYYNLIKDKIDESKINPLLKKIDKTYSLEKIIISDFSTLIDIQDVIKKSTHRKKIENFFIVKQNGKVKSIYENCQPLISSFFMNNIDLKSCHYCNIDHVNTVEEHYQFNSKEEFISKAPKEVLIMIDEISENTAEEIIRKRYSNDIINELKLVLGPKVYPKLFNWWNAASIANAASIDLKNIVIKKNHFTLDHVLPKSEFPFFSLSIYNLVPSCSSCNSKFKHMKEFTINKALAKICPTSDEFIPDDLIEFKMNFDVNDPDFESKIKKIKQIDDVEIRVENIQFLDGINEFLEIFKIKPRYEFHKSISFNLIKKRKHYPDSQLDEIEKIFQENGILIDRETFKKQVFGSIIFDKEDTNETFEKYKKDIAKQLGLIP